MLSVLDSSSSGKRRGDSSSLTESAGKSSASGTNSSTSGMGKKSASASQLSATGEWYSQKRILHHSMIKYVQDKSSFPYLT